MFKKYFIAAALLLMALPVVATQAKTIEVDGMDNLRFSEEVITVKPGEEITIKLVNKSKMPAIAMSHNWVLLKADADVHAFDKAALKAGKDNGYLPQDMSQVIAHTGLVGGGESDSVTFTVPKAPGEYEFICTFPGHFAAGMKGKLVVK